MYSVELLVYDLSKGMAKMMSLALTGKQFDGIWHTSIVIHDTEFYYSQGINAITPLSSEHGEPVKRTKMGTTAQSLADIKLLLKDLEDVFTVDAYHIINNNCNHFTDVVLKKLELKGCPDDIMSLAAEVMATPFGAMVKPLFEKMFVGKRKEMDQEMIHNELNSLVGKKDGDLVFETIQSALD